MDPATIIGLTAAIQQLLGGLFKFGRDVCNAKREINQLCSELLALKAALEHVQLNLEYDRCQQACIKGDVPPTLSAPMLMSSEFKTMVTMTEATLTELLIKTDIKPGSFRSSLKKFTWPMKNVTSYIDRLERLKGWFVLATTSENVQICKESYMKLCSIERQLQNRGSLQEQHQNDKHRRLVKKWLAPYDPYLSYKKSISIFQEGTGEWFLNGAYQAWLAEQGPPILLLRAKRKHSLDSHDLETPIDFLILAGAGKTYFTVGNNQSKRAIAYKPSSAAIKRLQLSEMMHDSEICLGYFFCSFTDQESQDPRNILGSFLAQMYEAYPQLQKDINERYHGQTEQSQQEHNKLAIHEMEDLMIQFSNQLSGIFLFLDAPNESKQSSRILQILTNLVEKGTRLRIMTTSTEALSMNLNLPLIGIVDMKLEDIASDIKKYIRARLQSNEDLQELPTALKHDIREVLEHNADGMFRFVQCHLENLVNQKTIQEIRTALKDIPRTLEQTYCNILSRIPKADIQRTKRALFWLTFSLQPMKFAELCEAIIMDNENLVINDEVRLLRRSRQALLQSWGSLISYDNTTTMVTLAHSSVQSYLVSREIQRGDVCEFYLDQGTAHSGIAVNCIKYLFLPPFSSGYCTSKTALTQRFDDWPLLRYIARTLFEHLSYVTLDEPIRSLLLRFFATHKQPRGGNFGAWVQAFFPIGNDSIESSTPLYYAARWGLLPVVRLILEIEGTKNLEVPGGMYGSTPLHVAAWKGQIDVVEALLEVGANAKEVNREGKPGLLWAVKYGYGDVEQILREAGATLDEAIIKFDFANEDQMLKYAEESWARCDGTLMPANEIGELRSDFVEHMRSHEMKHQ
ncbi:hypothetical protein MMC17_007156 [Xylographa soralifera]|nr:hypothetical protein [Xylographa soralifera]